MGLQVKLWLGGKQAMFMDKISTGLDPTTAVLIANCLSNSVDTSMFAGEIVVGGKKVMLMDEISTGLDSATALLIAKHVFDLSFSDTSMLAGEIVVGGKKVMFMDEISTG